MVDQTIRPNELAAQMQVNPDRLRDYLREEWAERLNHLGHKPWGIPKDNIGEIKQGFSHWSPKRKCPLCHRGVLVPDGIIWVVYFPGNEEGSDHNVYRCSSCKIDIVFLAKSA